MTISQSVKASLIWLLIAVCAVINGVVRESLLAPSLGSDIALPISGITLSLIILVVTYLTFNFLQLAIRAQCFKVGAQWFAMTLLFEFGFGHYVAGKPWYEIFQVFNVMAGDLFLLVLVTCLFAPLLVSKIKAIQ